MNIPSEAEIQAALDDFEHENWQAIINLMPQDFMQYWSAHALPFSEKVRAYLTASEDEDEKSEILEALGFEREGTC